jgi:hypothetical protein
MKKLIALLSQCPEDLSFSPLWPSIISKIVEMISNCWLDGHELSIVTIPIKSSFGEFLQSALVVNWNKKILYFDCSSSDFDRVHLYESEEDWKNYRNFTIIDNLDTLSISFLDNLSKN